jgi:hypothetical protein
MARVLYTAAPPAPAEVPGGPSAIPGGGYQRIQSSPEAFGGLIGQAEQRLGAGVEQGGTQVWDAYRQQQELYNTTVANDQTNKYQDATTKLLFGDPSTGDTGFYGKSGQAAMDAGPAVRQQLLQQREQLGAGLNPRAKIAFDADTRRLQAYMLSDVGRHLDQAQKVYQHATNQATIDLSVQNAALNFNNDSAFVHSLADARAAASRQARDAGAPEGSEIERDLTLQATSRVVQGRVEALAKTDPIAASKLIDTYRSMMREETVDHLKGILSQGQVSAAVDDELRHIRSPGNPLVTPAQVSDAATQQGVDPKLANATAAIESGHGANLGTRGNIYQMGPTERASVGGGAAQGSPANQVQQGVAFLGKTKQELAASLGRDPTNAEVYLAHQQGVKGATTLINNPDKRAGDLVGDAAINSNGGSADAPASQFVQHWRQTYNSTEQRYAQGPSLTATDAGAQGPQQPDYSAAERRIWQRDDLTDVQKRQAAKQFQDQANIDWTQKTREYEQHQRETRQAAETSASNIVSRLIKDPASVDPKTDIADNPAFNERPDLKENLVKLQQHGLAGGDQHDVKTYGKGFYDAYRAVHAPAGDPTRITDPGQLYSHVGPNGDLTLAGVEKLTGEIQGKRTPEGEAWSEMQKQFFKNAHAQISGSDEGLHIKDPRGEELFLKFMAQALPAINAARDAGKTPAEILGPESKDYVGKLVDQFKRPMAQWIKDIGNSAGAGAAAIDTPEQLKAAVGNGQISRDEGIAEAIKRGWIAPSAVTPPAPAVAPPIATP